MSERVTAAQLIAELQKLPPDAEVVTSIYGCGGRRPWPGDHRRADHGR